MDLQRKIRKVERATGLSIALVDGVLVTYDQELDEQLFELPIGTPSNHEKALHRFHEDIYHARARRKHQMQGGKCALCGRQMGDMGECDHILTRGAHGRDDRMENLQIVCNPCHRTKHGERVKYVW